ncbi:unnamed protein product [Acanthosepion pharaonis]|uniref:Uncharacterized protein n=1 Tax=Acanthosepion pharaonis TaxID=158019 RepID=A0A812D763_ACAPH|nr:unnamed protein product [Sepia pharaonis]
MDLNPFRKFEIESAFSCLLCAAAPVPPIVPSGVDVVAISKKSEVSLCLSVSLPHFFISLSLSPISFSPSIFLCLCISLLFLSFTLFPISLSHTTNTYSVPNYSLLHFLHSLPFISLSLISFPLSHFFLPLPFFSLSHFFFSLPFLSFPHTFLSFSLPISFSLAPPFPSLSLSHSLPILNYSLSFTLLICLSRSPHFILSHSPYFSLLLSLSFFFSLSLFLFCHTVTQ